MRNLIARRLGMGILAAACLLVVSTASAQHVREVQRYLDDVEIYAPIQYGRLAVFPLRLHDGATLPGRWLSMDEALAQGVLRVQELGESRVPVVVVHNTSRRVHVILTSGQVLAGGKQTRTIREDIVLAPAQRLEIGVLCVEQHRWQGQGGFAASGVHLPQSIHKALRGGAGQDRIWAEVDRNNRMLDARTPTASLESALKGAAVQRRLKQVRAAVVPELPDDTVGFIFTAGNQAVGGEFFGTPALARSAFPSLLDSYSVDCVIHYRGKSQPLGGEALNQLGIRFLQRLQQARSEHVATAGSGNGIRIRRQGLIGDGVSLNAQLVHFGVQIQERLIPRPR